MSLTIGYLFAFVPPLLWLLVQQYRAWKRLAHIPGPPVAQFSIFWLLKHAWCGNLFPSLIDAGDAFGPLVRVGPNLLVCKDPDELKRISGIRSRYTKGPAYSGTRVTDGDHVVSQRDPAKHKALRAKMGPAYSIDVQPSMDRQISSLINLIDRKYATDLAFSKLHAVGNEHPPPSETMDFAEKIQFYALDCIGEIAFGEPFGFLELDEDRYSITHINDLSIRMATAAGIISWLPSMKYKWPFKYLLPREGDKAGFGILYGFTKALVDKRTAPQAAPKNDMMQAWIKTGMSKDDLMQHAMAHIIVGADVTANWARMVMLCLLTCPPAYMALQKEIDAAHESGRLSSPMVADSEARALPYLQAVLREAIRTHPAAVAPSKLSPVDTDQVCGYSIPGGTQIGANMPGLLRSETIFGHDADCFRPERWLEAALESDGQRLDRMKISLDLVFGAGKYYCLGSAIAHMEVRKLFVELFRRYDFAIVNSKKPLHMESYGIMVVQDFHIRIMRRSRAEGLNTDSPRTVDG